VIQVKEIKRNQKIKFHFHDSLFFLSNLLLHSKKKKKKTQGKGKIKKQTQKEKKS